MNLSGFDGVTARPRQLAAKPGLRAAPAPTVRSTHKLARLVTPSRRVQGHVPEHRFAKLLMRDAVRNTTAAFQKWIRAMKLSDEFDESYAFIELARVRQWLARASAVAPFHQRISVHFRPIV